MNELLPPELAKLGEKLRQECPPPYSDEALALRFTERYATDYDTSQPGRDGGYGMVSIGNTTTR